MFGSVVMATHIMRQGGRRLQEWARRTHNPAQKDREGDARFGFPGRSDSNRIQPHPQIFCGFGYESRRAGAVIKGHMYFND